MRNCTAIMHLGDTEFFNSVPPTAWGYIYLRAARDSILQTVRPQYPCCRRLDLRIVAVVACAPSPQVSIAVNGLLLCAVAAVERLHQVRVSLDPTRAPISDSMHVWFAQYLATIEIFLYTRLVRLN